MSNSLSNQEVADLLREVAAAYEIKGESFFKVRAYNTAADAIEHATSLVKDIWQANQLDSVPGLGKSIRGYLDVLFKTGEVKHFDEVKRDLPIGMFILLDIPGVGPKIAYKLASELKIRSLDDLRRAISDHRVQTLPGLGEKTEREILNGLEQFDRRTERMLLPLASQMAMEVIEALSSIQGVKRVDPLGSLRRQVATIGDVDLAVAIEDKNAEEVGRKVIEKFTGLPKVREILGQGESEANVTWFNGKRIDLRVQSESGYGSLLQHFTGSKHHNIHLRRVALQQGLSLSEHGIKRLKGIVEFKTEEDVYQYLGMDWIPPEIREDTGEIEAALEHRLPDLIELEDVKGDLHLHCDFDLQESHDSGQSSMGEFVEFALAHGYEYIAIGNHNPSVYNHTISQMIDLIKRKQAALDTVQKKYPTVKLLNEVEVDILANGDLAIENEGLKLLDVVVVSIHSSMNQSKRELTDRVLKALENPYTHILGHPTGRLLDHREGYELDWDQIFATAIKYNKAIEINSYYNRLDLPDTLVREAINRGVKLAINTDAHAVSHLDLMRYGVGVARRGWAQRKDVINAIPWEQFERFIKR